jgi:CBS domain-containing protein
MTPPTMPGDDDASAKTSPPASPVESTSHELDDQFLDRQSILELEAELLGSSEDRHPPPPPSLRKGYQRVDRRFELPSAPRLVRDLMSKKLFTIEPETPLARLEEHMMSFRFGHLPVVEGNKLVGLLTHGDLLHASSSFLSARATERDAIIHKLPASRIMQREIVTVGPDDTLADVALLMWESRLGCVPVVDGSGELVGMLTEADFLRASYFFLRAATTEKPTG